MMQMTALFEHGSSPGIPVALSTGRSSNSMTQASKPGTVAVSQGGGWLDAVPILPVSYGTWVMHGTNHVAAESANLRLYWMPEKLSVSLRTLDLSN